MSQSRFAPRLAFSALLLSTAPSALMAQGLDTIIVRGEKLDRSLMETASSVDVTDAEEASRRGINTTAELLERIPNLVTAEPTNLAPAVRGIDGTGPAQGADAFFAGTRPRLNYQVDGRTLTHNEAIFSDATLWDVERVEVYRGPQSTLQGRNAVAGAIVATTKEPTYALEGAGRILGGSDNTLQASAAVSGPIVQDQIAFRLSADWRTSESFVDFASYPAVEDPGEYRSLALRGKLLIEPAAAPDLRMLLTLSHLDAYAPQTADVVRPFGDHTTSYPFQPRFGTRATSGVFDLDWGFSDALALDGVVSLTELTVNRWAAPGDGNAKVDATELVIEPRLVFTGLEGRLDGVVGVHLFRNTQDEAIDLFGGGLFDDETQTNAVFGEATLGVTDRIDLTLGGRYESEERDRDGGAGPFLIDFHETYEEFLPKMSLAWQATDDLRTGVVVSRGYNAGGAGFTYEAPFLSYTYDAEHVWNYELFWRSTLAGGRMSLSGNIFYNDYSDLQLPFDLNPDPALWSYVVRNADQAETYGAELTADYLLMDALELFASVGLLKTEVTDYPGSGIEGNELVRSPAFSTTFGATYAAESGLELSAEARYSDAYYSDVLNDARGKTDPYWVASGKAAYNFGDVRVFASVTNIFDNVEPVLLYPGATPADNAATLLQPRTILAGLEFTF
jgi:outer membrane receptor protein involved in Fe transport